MQPDICYVVTKPSDDGTFEIGDHLWLLDDGGIVCSEAGGWISPDDVNTAMIGVEYEIDEEWQARRRAALQRQLEKLG